MHGHDDEVTPETAEAYMRNLTAFREAMRKEFPEPLIVIGVDYVDYGTGPSTATVHHKCARCEQVLDVPEKWSANVANTAIDAAMFAHQERCFRVGDWVRWERLERGQWAEGELLSIAVDQKHCYLRVERSGGWRGHELRPGEQRFDGPSWKSVSLRRIPRPAQATDERTRCCICGRYDTVSWECDHGKSPATEQPTLSARLGHLKHGPGGSGPSGPCDVDCRKCAVERKPPTIETPWIKIDDPHNPIAIIEATKYDGMTGKECLERFRATQHDNPIGWRIRWRSTSGETGLGMSFPTFDACDHAVRSFNDRFDRPRDLTHSVERDRLTPVQLAAARELWSLQLKAKIAASREAERCAVRVDDQGEP